jgi:hypothetical protein
MRQGDTLVLIPMKSILPTLILFLSVAVTLGETTFAQSLVPIARIISPIKEQESKGTVVIQGTAVSPSFSRYEVAYALEPDTTNWVIIGGNTQQVNNGILMAWNTRPLTDGSYALRLQVFNTDATVNESIVRNIRLTNTATTDSTQVVSENASQVSRPNELETARNVLSEITNGISAAPQGFLRGARYVAFAFTALFVYVVLKRLIVYFLQRQFQKNIDYGK